MTNPFNYGSFISNIYHLYTNNSHKSLLNNLSQQISIEQFIYENSFDDNWKTNDLILMKQKDIKKKNNVNNNIENDICNEIWKDSVNSLIGLNANTIENEIENENEMKSIDSSDKISEVSGDEYLIANINKSSDILPSFSDLV